MEAPDSGSGMVVGVASEGVSVPAGFGWRASWGCDVGCSSACLLVEEEEGRGGGGGEANSPVLWIIEPSLRERMKVDWTPGRELRCDRRALTCCGIWDVCLSLAFAYL